MNYDFIYNKLILNIKLIFNKLENQKSFNDYDYFNTDNNIILKEEYNIKNYYISIVDEIDIKIYYIFFDFFIILYKHLYKNYDLMKLINYYGYNHLYAIIQDKLNNKKKDFNILIELINLIYDKYKYETLNNFINFKFNDVEIYLYSFYKENKKTLELNLDENNKFDIDLREFEINKINYKFNLLNLANYINIYNFHLFLENKNLIGFNPNIIEERRAIIEKNLLSLLIEINQNINDKKNFILLNSFLNNSNLNLIINNEKIQLMNLYYQIIDKNLNNKYDNYWFDIIIYKNIKISFNIFYICLMTHKKNKIINSLDLVDDLYKYYTLKEIENDKKIYSLMKNNFLYLFLGRHINKSELLEFFNFNVDLKKWILINENHQKYMNEINNNFLNKLYDNLNNNKLTITYFNKKENIKNCAHEYIVNDIIKYKKKTLQNLIYKIIDKDFNCLFCGLSLSSFIINLKDNLGNSSNVNKMSIVESLNNDEKYNQYKILINYYSNYLLRLIRIYNITEISSDGYLLNINNKFIIKILLDFFIFIKNKEEEIRKNIKLTNNSDFFIFILDKNIVSNTLTMFLERIDKFLFKKQNNIFIVFSLILISYYNNNINKNLFKELINKSYNKTFKNLKISPYLIDNIKYLTNITFTALLYGGFWNFEQSFKNKSFIEKLSKFDYINNTILDYLNIINYYKKEKEVKLLYNLIIKKLNKKDDDFIIDRNYTKFLNSYSKNRNIKNHRNLLLKIYKRNLNNNININYFIKNDIYINSGLFFDSNLENHILDINRFKINKILSCKTCGLIFNNKYNNIIFNEYKLKYQFKNDYNYELKIIKYEYDLNLTNDDFNEMIDNFFNEKSFLLFYNIKILGRIISKIILSNNNIELITKTSSILINKSNKFRNIVYLSDSNFLNNNLIDVELELNNIGKLYFNKKYNNYEFFNLIKSIVLKSIDNTFIIPGYRKLIKNLYNYIINFKLDYINNNINNKIKFNSFGFNINYNNLDENLNLFKNSILMNDIFSFNLILTYFFVIIKNFLIKPNNLLYVKLINNININIIEYNNSINNINYYKLFFGI